jgi:ApeA-like protein
MTECAVALYEAVCRAPDGEQEGTESYVPRLSGADHHAVDGSLQGAATPRENPMNDDLTAEQTWRGNFWLPDNPDIAQQGFLTYDPQDGVMLSLVGGFDDRKRTPTSPTGYVVTNGPGRFAVIHGAVGSGSPVTLVDCRTARWQLSDLMDKFRDHDITAARVLTGVLLKDPDAAVFSELVIELENLTEWDRHDEVTIYVDPSEDSPQRKYWRIHVEPLKPLSIKVGELTVELVRRYREPKFRVRRDRLDTTATTFSYFNVRTSQPKSMMEWFEVTKALQDLLTLAMDAPCALLSESLTPSTAVVLLNLLHQLGIPKERMKLAIDYNRTLKSAKYLANKQWPATGENDEDSDER